LGYEMCMAFMIPLGKFTYIKMYFDFRWAERGTDTLELKGISQGRFDCFMCIAALVWRPVPLRLLNSSS